MLSKSTLKLIASCYQPFTSNLVRVKVVIGEKTFNFRFPQNSKLAANLEKVKAPLDF